MPSPSPTCQVKDGAGAFVATTNGVDVTPGNTVTVALAATTGVDTWQFECIGTDETTTTSAVNATLTINTLTKQATFTAPAAGKAYLFQSRVNGGVDVGGTSQSSYTTTFKVATQTSAGLRVGALNETFENSATHGATGLINEMIRAVDGLISGAAELVTLVGTGTGPAGAFAIGDVVCSANDATDKTKVKLATAANLLAAGGAVKAVLLETGVAGETKQAAGDGDTVAAAVLSFTLTGDGEGTGVVLNTATGRALRAKYPADSQTPLGAADAQGNTKLSFVAPGVMSRLDNLSFISLLDYVSASATAAAQTAAWDLAHADAVAQGCGLRVGFTLALNASRVCTVPLDIVGKLSPQANEDAIAAVFQVDQSGGPSYVDQTAAANDATSANFTPFPAVEAAGAEGTGDWVCFGSTVPFAQLTIDYAGGTAGVGGAVVWEYWNGSAWVSLLNVYDASRGFTVAAADGLVVRWSAIPSTWTARTINGSASLYYVRARCSTLYTTNPVLDQAFVGVCLTIAAPIVAPNRQIFGALPRGEIRFSDSCGIESFQAIWWGLDPSGVADSGPGLRACLHEAPANALVRLPPGTFTVSGGAPLFIRDDNFGRNKRGIQLIGTSGSLNPNGGTRIYYAPPQVLTTAATYVSHGNGGSGQQMQRYGGMSGLDPAIHTGRLAWITNNAQPGPYIVAQVHSATEASFFHPGTNYATAADDTANSGHVRIEIDLPVLDVRARGCRIENIEFGAAASRLGAMVNVGNAPGVGFSLTTGVTIRNNRFWYGTLSTNVTRHGITIGIPYTPDFDNPTYHAVNGAGVDRVADTTANGTPNVSECTIENNYFASGAGWAAQILHGSPSGQSVDIIGVRNLFQPVVCAYRIPSRMNASAQMNHFHSQFGPSDDWAVCVAGNNRARCIDNCYQEQSGSILYEGSTSSVSQEHAVTQCYFRSGPGGVAHPSRAMIKTLNQGPIVVEKSYIGMATDVPSNIIRAESGLVGEPTRIGLHDNALLVPLSTTQGEPARGYASSYKWPIVFSGSESLLLEIEPLQGAFGAAASQVWQVAAAGPTFVDITSVFNSATNADTSPFPAVEAVGDYIAIGSLQRYCALGIDNLNGTAGVGGVVAWEYWNGSAWVAHTGLIDRTAGFTATVGDSKEVTWDIPENTAATALWEPQSLNGNPATPLAAVFQVDQSGGPSYVDQTAGALDATVANFTPFPAVEAAGAEGTGDWVCFGYATRFQALIIDYAGGTAGVGGAVAWEYWNGDVWAALPGISDGTTSFTAAVGDGKRVKWTEPERWTPRVINGSASLYYVRARCSTLYSTNPILDRASIGLYYSRARVTTVYSTNPVLDQGFVSHRREFTFRTQDFTAAGVNGYPWPAFGLAEVWPWQFCKVVRTKAAAQNWGITGWVEQDGVQTWFASVFDGAASRIKSVASTRVLPISKVWVFTSPSTYVDETTDANSEANADFLPFPAVESVGDAVLIGHTTQFCKLVFDYANGTAGIGGVVAWEYWTGSAWVALPGVTDGTAGFTAAVGDGKTVTWATVPSGWNAASINGSASLFWVRARVTTVYSTNPVLDQAWIGMRDARALMGTAQAFIDSSGAAASTLGTLTRGVLEAHDQLTPTTLVDAIVSAHGNHCQRSDSVTLPFPTIDGARFTASSSTVQADTYTGILHPPGNVVTLTAAATTVVADARITATSRVRPSPANAAAAALVGGVWHDISANVPGVSYSIKTGSGAAAAGTEQYACEIWEPVSA